MYKKFNNLNLFELKINYKKKPCFVFYVAVQSVSHVLVSFALFSFERNVILQRCILFSYRVYQKIVSDSRKTMHLHIERF